jgi:rhamnosyltransferase
VVVRSKDKAGTIEQTLRGLREQTVETEVILVDSGSTDGTVEIARPYCDQVLTVPASEFSYGGALNLGARHAGGKIVFALSAHCVPSSPHWVEWSLEAYADDDVVGTMGEERAPDGTALTGPTRFTLPFPALRADPTWGFSNHASSWRKRTWERFPFNERLISCEDKEWMWRVLAAGFCVVADPKLFVASQHRRQAGVRALYKRVYREHLVLAELLDYERAGPRKMLAKWWSDFPYSSRRPPWQRRLSPWRTAELLGEYVGDFVGSGRRGEHTLPVESWGLGPSAALPRS